MFEPSLKKSGKKGILTMKGDLTVDYAAEMKSALLDAVSRYKAVEIVFTDVKQVDFACLQLLCAAHKTAYQQEKSISVDPEIPAVLGKALSDSGFRRNTGCFSAAVNECFWLSQKEKKGV